MELKELQPKLVFDDFGPLKLPGDEDLILFIAQKPQLTLSVAKLQLLRRHAKRLGVLFDDGTGNIAFIPGLKALETVFKQL